MTDRARPLPFLFARSRGIGTGALFLLVSIVSAALASSEMVAVPLAEDRNSLLLTWMSCLPAVVATPLFAPPDHAREVAFPGRPLATLRVGWLATLTAASPLLYVLAQSGSGAEADFAWWYARNHLLLLGGGAVASTWLGPATAWLPGAVFSLATWFVGTKDAAGTPWPWALLQQHPGSVPAAVVTGTLCVAAVVL